MDVDCFNPENALDLGSYFFRSSKFLLKYSCWRIGVKMDSQKEF